MSSWTIRRYQGPPVPERWSAAEQKAIRKATGVIPQRPGVPGPVVIDDAGCCVLAISDFSAVRPDPDGTGLLSRAEVLTPANGTAWPAAGEIDHPGINWTGYRYVDLSGAILGEGAGVVGRSSCFGAWGGATVSSGPRVWTLQDLIRPESDEDARRRERRRIFKGERLQGRVLGHRFVDATGAETGSLAWVGDRPPDHHNRPYEWRLEWDGAIDDGVLVGAMAAALRFMAYSGNMLSS